MYRINTNADNGNRQIQPRDFSFLSEANQQLEAALCNILLTLVPGSSSTAAVIASGMQVCYTTDTSDPSNPFINDFYISQGSLLMQGRLFHFPQYNFYEDAQCLNHFMTNHQAGSGYVSPTINQIISPSPVYSSTNQQDTYVHTYDYVDVQQGNYSPTSDDISFNEIRYPDGTTLEQRLQDVAMLISNDGIITF